MKNTFYLRRISPKIVAGLLILSFGLISGCANKAPIKEVQAKKSPDLKNITLNIKDLSGKRAKLVNGAFEGDHLFIHVLREASADLNQDGLVDGVVIIYENSGGSGNFRELCLMLNDGDKLVQTDIASIGDRIKITNLSINKDIITVDYMDRGKNDPYSTTPYIKKRVRYLVQGMKLKPLSNLHHGG